MVLWIEAFDLAGSALTGLLFLLAIVLQWLQ